MLGISGDCVVGQSGEVAGSIGSGNCLGSLLAGEVATLYSHPFEASLSTTAADVTMLLESANHRRSRL